LVVPALIANVGIADHLELVLEGRHQFLLGEAAGAARARLVDTALSLKAVVRPGELQENSGPSVATEVGVLLPTLNGDPGVGAQATVIVSRRFARASRPRSGTDSYRGPPWPHLRRRSPGARLTRRFSWALKHLSDKGCEIGRRDPEGVQNANKRPPSTVILPSQSIETVSPFRRAL